MMTELAIQKTWCFEGTDEVRQAIAPDGTVVFDARDICGPLCITKVRDACARLDADERYAVNTGVPVNQHGGATKIVPVNYVTEPGVYKLVATARQRSEWIDSEYQPHIADANARIKRFQRWLFHEVLPAIRKTGSYSLPGGDHKLLAVIQQSIIDAVVKHVTATELETRGIIGELRLQNARLEKAAEAALRRTRVIEEEVSRLIPTHRRARIVVNYEGEYLTLNEFCRREKVRNVDGEPLTGYELGRQAGRVKQISKTIPGAGIFGGITHAESSD